MIAITVIKHGNRRVYTNQHRTRCITVTHFYCPLQFYLIMKPKVKGKKKAIPLQAWTDPEGSKGLGLSDFKTIGT